MKGIKAFVGHSFNEADREVNRVFLDYFTALSKVESGFTWDHAEEAEARELAKKVLAKIQDKNLFIGICTKKELVVAKESLTPTLLNKRIQKVDEADLEWKTSDWITQEIGLAVGRQMSIVLLLEEGVRIPGGLFGDIEHIRFPRAEPRLAFEKLLQMLGSLTPRTATVTNAEAEPAGAAESEKEGPAVVDEEPKSDWTPEKYNRRALRLMIGEDVEGLEKLDRSFRSSALAGGKGVIQWEATREYYKIILSKAADFDKLKKLAKENPDLPRLTAYVARGYAEFDEHQVAAKEYTEAAVAATVESDRIKWLASAAIEHAQDNEIQKAREIIEQLRSDVRGKPELATELLRSLDGVVSVIKNDFLQLASLERRIEEHPADTKLRFQLAYQHSQAENKDLALYHYDRIPVMQRTSMAWNNIGVSYGDFEMPVESVQAWRRAELEKETLAMSNLGFKLLNAGFWEEAQGICDRALAIDKHHKNVAVLLNRLGQVKEEENGKLKETLEKARGKAEFFRSLGRAIVTTMPAKLSSKWASWEGTFDVVVDGASIRFSGTFDRAENPFSKSFGLGSAAVSQEVSFSGEMWGRMVIAAVTRKTKGTSPSLLGDAPAQKAVVMYFDQDCTEIHVMENHESVNPTFYSFMPVS